MSPYIALKQLRQVSILIRLLGLFLGQLFILLNCHPAGHPKKKKKKKDKKKKHHHKEKRKREHESALGSGGNGADGAPRAKEPRHAIR